MTRREIAETIVAICKNDASFCKDIKGDDPDRFLSEISEEASEKAFRFSVDRYLASFGVRGHLYFYRKGENESIGFRVRRYQDSLFVTDPGEGLPLMKGDEIVAIDFDPIPRAAEKFHVFVGESADRCSDGWEKIISYSDKITVTRGGKRFEYPIRTYPKREEKCSYEQKRLNEKGYYIKLRNFFDEAEMGRFLDGCKEEIERSRYLVIDVRENCGGSDTVFLPLLKFCLEKDDVMCGKSVFPSREEILYTERNAENRIRFYQSYLEKSVPEEVRQYLRRLIFEQRKNRGKGFVPADGDGFLFPDSGSFLPEKIFVLTDEGCGSSGESFVQTVAGLHKVTVIGRPTMGICDYSNLAYFDFGEYVLHYPTSRSMAIDEGKGMRGRGLQPDILIPWTPNHLREDVDLMTAIQFFGE